MAALYSIRRNDRRRRTICEGEWMSSTATLGDALRLLGLPLDETVDEGKLVDAYRRAAWEHHPDSAPEGERDSRTETMREINGARDVVRASISVLGERPYTALPREPADHGAAWWEEALTDDPSGLGVRWNPTAQRIPWAQRFEAARLALCVAVGDDVSIERDGVLELGRVTQFDVSTRVARRIQALGLPVELRRVGVEVKIGDEISTVDAADCRAAGWRCPVCLRTSPHGEPRERPCPRCLRRFRTSYDSWREAGRTRRRVQRRLRALEHPPQAFAPRRFPRFREIDDGLTDARERIESLAITLEGLSGALAAHQRAVEAATERLGRTRTAQGAANRRRDRARSVAELARVETARDQVKASLEEQRRRAIELDAERGRLERELLARHDVAERSWVSGRAKRRDERAALESELRRAEIELGALEPDSLALLDGFDAWDQAPDRWLAVSEVGSAG